MKLKTGQIENLLENKKDKSSLVDMILAYAGLKQKIENTKEHSWYFKRGMDSKLEELASLNTYFERTRKLFNEADIDFFLQKINENNEYLSSLEGKYKGFAQRISCSWKISDNEFFNELIQLKAKTEVLMPIDHYLENPDEFLKILD